MTAFFLSQFTAESAQLLELVAELAECKGKSDLFFGGLSERPQARERRESKARNLCKDCSVTEICRRFARHNREYGFWGGENEQSRHEAGFTLSAPIGVQAAPPTLA